MKRFTLLIILVLSALFALTQLDAVFAQAPTMLDFGETACGEINSPAEVDTFSFEGNAGDIILVRMSRSSGNLQPFIEILDSNYNSLAIGSFEIRGFALPSTGRYNIRGFHRRGTSQGTGTYCIYLQRLNDPGNATAINFGETVSDTINTVAEAKTFAFQANQGDQLLARVFSSVEEFPRISIYDPNGEQIIRSVVRADEFSLPLSGRYTVLIEFVDPNTGAFNLHVQRLNDPRYATAINFGETVSDTINAVAEAIAFTFQANQGDRLLARVFRSSGDIVPETSVYNPDGELLEAGYGIATEINQLSFPLSGRYTALVGDHSGLKTGAFSLHVQRLNDPGHAININYGQTLPNIIGKPAEMDAYTFTGLASKVVKLRMTRNTGDLVPGIRVYNPNGELLEYRGAGLGSTAEIDQLSLPLNGRYTVLAYNSDGLGTGTYEISLICLTPPCPSGDTNQVRITYVYPDNGGDIGSVTVQIAGVMFDENATVSIVKEGESIYGNPVIVDDSGLFINTTFDLTGRSQGLWDVVVTNPNNSTAVLPNGFTIEKGRAPEIWVDIVGRPTIRAGRPTMYTVTYGNTGNVDAQGVPLWIEGIPQEAKYRFITKIYPPIQPPNDQINWADVPLDSILDGERIIPLLLPVVPASYSGTVQFEMTTHLTVTGQFDLRVGYSEPLSSPGGESNPQLQKCLEGLLDVALDELLDFVVSNDCKRKGIEYLSANYKVLQSPNGWPTVVSFLQLWAKGVDVIVTCAGKTLPISQSLRVAWKITKEIKKGWDTGELLIDCGKALIPHYPAKLSVHPVVAIDPNDKIGSTGYGTERYVSGFQPLKYSIIFENLETATAPAQEVTVTDGLDSNLLDLNTLSFRAVSLGDKHVVPFQGQRQFKRDIDLRPDNNLMVRVDLSVSTDTGLLTGRLISLDPATGEPPEDPLAGFLPPNINPPEGEGSIFFTVMPKQGLGTGTMVRNSASIVFDANAPIATPEWFNTLDYDRPISRLTLAAANDSSLSFTWTSTDVGSGVAEITLFVSKNGGAFVPWLVTSVADSSAMYKIDGTSKYEFYSRARDNAGNFEDVKTPDVSTLVKETLDSPPQVFALFQNFPNPFNPETQIRFDLPGASQVTLKVYNFFGQEVRILVNGQTQVGSYTIRWNGKNNQGVRVPSGVYFYRLKAGEFVKTLKMVLIR